MTLIVNLLGGPGVGKSTIAAGVFYKLKSQGINCEYIQEYAKDKTWQEEEFVLGCQPYITAKQLFRQHRLLDKVDIAITDAPLLNGLIYPGHYTGEPFTKWLLDTFNQFNNINIYLKRNLENHPYSQAGRSQTLEESQYIDDHMLQLLTGYEIPFTTLDVNPITSDEVIKCLNLSMSLVNQ